MRVSSNPSQKEHHRNGKLLDSREMSMITNATAYHHSLVIYINKCTSCRKNDCGKTQRLSSTASSWFSRTQIVPRAHTLESQEPNTQVFPALH